VCRANIQVVSHQSVNKLISISLFSFCLSNLVIHLLTFPFQTRSPHRLLPHIGRGGGGQTTEEEKKPTPLPWRHTAEGKRNGARAHGWLVRPYICLLGRTYTTLHYSRCRGQSVGPPFLPLPSLPSTWVGRGSCSRGRGGRARGGGKHTHPTPPCLAGPPNPCSCTWFSKLHCTFGCTFSWSGGLLFWQRNPHQPVCHDNVT
jgi:hypothetical protein